ncbi:CRPV-369 [Crowpox virus]|nr:CRPV-369 [Crowpox virus]
MEYIDLPLIFVFFILFSSLSYSVFIDFRIVEEFIKSIFFLKPKLLISFCREYLRLLPNS